MKHAFITLAGLALLAGAPATARALPAPAPVQASDLDSRLNQAWSDLNTKWLSGAITDREFQVVTDLLIKVTEDSKVVYPDSLIIRFRLQAAIDDLKARAATVVKNGAYVDTVWEQIVDFRVNRQLAILKEKLAARGASEADWTLLSAEITKRAEAAKDNPQGAATVLAALRARIADLQGRAAKAALTVTDFKALEIDLSEDRQGRAAYALRLRALIAKRATHEDFVRVSDTTKDRAQAAGIAVDTVAAYMKEIDRIEALAGNNLINQEEFDKMITALQIRMGYSKT